MHSWLYSIDVVLVDATDEDGRITESHCVTGSAGLGFLFTIVAINFWPSLIYGARGTHIQRGQTHLLLRP